MSGIGRTIQQSLTDALKSLVEEFRRKCGEDYSVEHLIKRLSRTIEDLENTKPPIIPTRRYLSAIDYLVHSILKFRNIFYEYLDQHLSLEDLRRGVSEYEEALKIYRRIALSERFKTQIYMAMPQTALIFTIIYSYTLGIRIGFEYFILPVILSITSLLIVYKSPLAGHVINSLSALILVLRLTYSSSGATALSLILVFTLATLTLFMSITYIHLSYVVTSKRNIDILKKSLDELLTKISRVERMEKKEVAEKTLVEKIYGELLSLYKKLYGDYGEEYLNYRIALLVLQGLPRDEAIRKLYSEVKEFKEIII